MRNVRMAAKSNPHRLKPSTLEWLERHPKLIERLERLHEIEEDSRSDIGTLDKAEHAAIEQVDRLGKEILGHWLGREEKEAAQQACERKGWRKHSIKNCE